MSRVERKMRRRRAFFRFLLLIFTIFIIVSLGLNTNLFLIDNIKVIGNNKVSKDSIIKGSTINIGENQFKISKKAGEKSLLNLPYIKDVKIKRKFPKGIIIEVVERKEIAQFKSISSYIIFDIEGYILEIRDSEDEKLPLLIGFDVVNKSPGDNIFLDAEESDVLDFISEGHAIGLLRKIKSINLEDIDNINIALFDGIPVDFGSLNNVKYKLNLLNEILIDIEKKGISCKMIIMNKGENPIIVLNQEEGG